MRSASSNRELRLRGAKIGLPRSDPIIQLASDGPADSPTTVPAGHGARTRAAPLWTSAWPPPAEGACADRSDETNPTPVVSITVAASSYVGAPTGASYGCRWDPPVIATPHR